jgi:hypothetical protein
MRGKQHIFQFGQQRRSDRDYLLPAAYVDTPNFPLTIKLALNAVLHFPHHGHGNAGSAAQAQDPL